jgi:hypothetical protein
MRWICLGLRMSERWRLWDFKSICFLYSATNAFQCFNCSKLAIRLTATLIDNLLFIWLKKIIKEMSCLNLDLNSGPLNSQASVQTPRPRWSYMLTAWRKPYYSKLGFVTLIISTLNLLFNTDVNNHGAYCKHVYL